MRSSGDSSALTESTNGEAASPTPDPLLADEVVRLLTMLGGRNSVRILTHILCLSPGPVTQEVVRTHKSTLKWLPSPLLPQRTWLEDRDLIRASCDADPRIHRDGYDMVELVSATTNPMLVRR